MSRIAYMAQIQQQTTSQNRDGVIKQFKVILANGIFILLTIFHHFLQRNIATLKYWIKITTQ